MPRLLLAALALLIMPLTVLAGDSPTEERWYIIEMQGHRAGWMRESVTTTDRDITSNSEMSLTIKRGQISLTIKVASDFVETPDGKPVSMRSVMQLGAMPTTTEYTFTPNGVEVVKSAGNGAKPAPAEKQPLPQGEWLTPRAVERHMTGRIAAGDTEISVRSVDPLTGLKPITATHKLLERTSLDVVGRTVPALKWASTTDAYPGLSTTDFTDAHGDALRTETDLIGTKLTVVRADKDLALAKLDPPELLVSTLIKPDKPIRDPRKLRRAGYVIESTGDALPDIVTTASQRFERLDGKSGRLTVDLDATSPAPEGEAADGRFADCSNMITCGDEGVKQLAADALKRARLSDDAPATKKAEAVRAFVHQYISKKSLGVGFASAAEVAATRTGDCSEHGVLLCALLRANHIPSRVISGLVYVDGFAGEETVFGYHMWAQALLDVDGRKRWVDLDAALSADEPSDATHIALAPTSLSDDDTTNSLVKLAPLIGTLKIRVEEPK